MTRLIILRPEPGASETVARAKELGLDAVAIPMFAIEPVAWEAPEQGRFDAVLITSANALRFGGEKVQDYRGLKAYCVGQATADAARAAGFDVAAVGKAGVERLLASIDADQRLLHLAGEDRTRINDAPQDLTTVVVYRSSVLPFDRRLEEAEGSVVLLHSSRAGKRVAEAADALHLDRSKIAIAAISEQAAQAAGGGWGAVSCSADPDDPSLLALAQTLCDKRC